MKTGMTLIYLAFAATIFSGLFYFLVTRTVVTKKKSKQTEIENKSKLAQKNYARYAYYFTTFFILAAAFYLYFLIFTHQFQVKYVYQYSSRDLSFGLLLSTFWAGQEGSFLLWSLLTAVMGLFLIKSSKEYENYSMLFLNLIQGFFLIILIKASPFETFAQRPPDGSGLNPLLQNFWMIIHPPVLFIGYAAIAFPLVLAITALLRKEYDKWISLAFPWTLFSSLTLGAGIILGAFWSYETLGWGGYWGWDPVENSSLIPWLTILALLHGIITQKKNGALRKTNFFLSIASYLLVLYATFLTRSGILADFSVHSFVDLGINTYLIVFMATILVISFRIFFLRYKQIPVKNIDSSTLNRENALFFSIIIYLIMTILIFFGTSSPIITGLFGDPSQTGISFYNKVNLPLGIFMALLLGIAPTLLWKEENTSSIFKRISLSVSIALVVMIIAIMAGISGVLNIIFIFAAGFAFLSNCIVLLQKLKKGINKIPGPLTHFGFGIILISIIISGNTATSRQLILEKEMPVNVFDYELTFTGISDSPDGKDVVNIRVQKGEKIYDAAPRLYYSEMNKGMMREPDIKPGFIADLYISPLEYKKESDLSSLSMVKGETAQIADYTITFVGFEMSNHEQGGHFVVSANLEVMFENQKHVVKPAIFIKSDGREAQPAVLPASEENISIKDHSHPSVILAGLNADEKRIELEFDQIETNASEKKSEQLVVEVSKKPFMSILWLGTIILTLGTALALKKYM